jgi:glucosamine--fructose-6-phosphate aminotransferase (isomerizing)
MSEAVNRTPSRMLREAREAPAVVAKMLAENADLAKNLGALLRRKVPPFAVTCARGSSDNAATFAKYLLEIRLGLVTASVGPSIRSVYAAAPNVANALFLAISQSGRSPDLQRLAEAARAGGAITIAIVNDPASPLAQACEHVVPLHAGPELSVAATKSWICSLAAILQIVAFCAEDQQLLEEMQHLPASLAQAVEQDWQPAVEPIARVEHLYVAARGIGLGLAQEAALKLKETCGIHAEALSAAELMHGPLTLVGKNFPVLVFSQHDEAYQSIADLISILGERGVPVIEAGPPTSGGMVLPCDPTLNPLLMPLALAQSFYGLLDQVARARGRDPDAPPHLKKVTETL